MRHPFYEAIGTDGSNRKEVQIISKKLGINISRLDYYDTNSILPSNKDLETIQGHLGIGQFELMIKMGISDMELKRFLAQNFGSKDFHDSKIANSNIISPEIKFKTPLGKLYQGDCIDLLRTIEDETFDVVFADPPFNLNKFYLSKMNDNIGLIDYLEWSETWLKECIRILKFGGSLFLWNLPRWNSYFSEYLNHRMYFRNWIATDIKFSLPIQGRLYPCHYSLLYYTKGEKPNSFHPDRLPMEICKKCYSDIKDYGGYKDKMNPNGINLTDIWYDIPPVRHKKYKKRTEANELSIKLLDRIIEMSSNEGDIIFDPFGGSGTTYIVAELKMRRWIGIELGPLDDIISRFNTIDEEQEFLVNYRKNYNKLFPEKVKAKRQQLNMWTDESFNNK
jgi:site-specific DNA-methyltransferase (adenine-specific)